MSKQPECIAPLLRAGITLEDAYALRCIAMTLHRWHELECGDSNEHGSWAIERQPETARKLEKLSSPACSPRYTMTIPAGTACKQVQIHRDWGWVVEDVSRVIGGNAHDLEHHYIWLDDSEVIERPYLVHHHYMHGRGRDTVTRTPIADKEAGALKRLRAIMVRYPVLKAYQQGDPRGAALWILRPGDVPEGKDAGAYYPRGIAVYK